MQALPLMHTRLPSKERSDRDLLDERDARVEVLPREVTSSPRRKMLKTMSSTLSTDDESPQTLLGRSPKRKALAKKKKRISRARSAELLLLDGDGEWVDPTKQKSQKSDLSPVSSQKPGSATRIVTPPTPPKTYDLSCGRLGRPNSSDGSSRRSMSSRTSARSFTPTRKLTSSHSGDLEISDFSSKSRSGQAIFTEGTASSSNAKAPPRRGSLSVSTHATSSRSVRSKEKPTRRGSLSGSSHASTRSERTSGRKQTRRSSHSTSAHLPNERADIHKLGKAGRRASLSGISTSQSNQSSSRSLRSAGKGTARRASLSNSSVVSERSASKPYAQRASLSNTNASVRSERSVMSRRASNSGSVRNHSPPPEPSHGDATSSPESDSQGSSHSRTKEQSGNAPRNSQRPERPDHPFLTDGVNTPHLSRTRSIEPRAPVRRISGQDLQRVLDDTEDLLEEIDISDMTCLYDCARACDWDRVLQECQEYPRDANYVHPTDGTTALHLAIMSRANPLMRDGELEQFQAAPLKVIDELLKACPEAGIMRCAAKKYTPLSYACLVSDRGYDMEDGARMVRIILKHAPESAYVFTEEGFSALDIHIISYSRFHAEKQEIFSGERTSTVILKTLLEKKPALADARSYKRKMRGPLELLYRCNKSEFEEAMTTEIGDHSQKEKLKQRCASAQSGVLSDWWAWKWSLLLLKSSFKSNKVKSSRFSAVHAAARVIACPLPILTLAMNAFPEKVMDRDPRNDIYNLPLHEICSWRCDEEIISGDKFIVRRKAKAIRCLLEENMDAARMTNNLGETPLQLAIESCTPWDGGLEDLVCACPKGLKFPRRLRALPDDSGYAVSTDNLSSALSLCSDDSSMCHPVCVVDGMYPFLLAATMSHVSRNRRKFPSFLYSSENIDEHETQLAKKDLESTRSIFGLLRAKPEMLGTYIEDLS